MPMASAKAGTGGEKKTRAHTEDARTEDAHFAAEPVDRDATAAAVAASVSPRNVKGARSAAQSVKLGDEDAPTAAQVSARREEATRPP